LPFGSRSTIFRETIPVHGLLVDVDAPKLASVDPWALGLSTGAAVAVFRFKIGMSFTLAACCVASLFLHTAGMLR